MDVYEVASKHSDYITPPAPIDLGTPIPAERTHYARTKSEAIRHAKSLGDDETLVEPPTVYRCTLATTTQVQTVLDLLNGLKPRRVALVHGSLPLPQEATDTPTEADTSDGTLPLVAADE